MVRHGNAFTQVKLRHFSVKFKMFIFNVQLFECSGFRLLNLTAHKHCEGFPFTDYFGLFSPIVGLDIQQRFNVYYSGARRFGNEILSNTPFDPTGQRPQHAALKPHSTDQAAGHRENATSATEQGTAQFH